MQRFSSNSARIPGIDVLRVVLSFCVVVIHVLFYGGFRTHADFNNPGFYVLWFLGITVVCTVNCFAMISGFVMYGRQVKYTTILRLLLTALYHGLFITAVFHFCLPDAVSAANWIQAVFPVSQYEYWYLTAYFGVFFLAPLVIRGMEALSKKQATLLVITLIAVFSVLPTVTGTDAFGLSLGYSVLWILVMFIIGTYLRKYSHTLIIKKTMLLGVFAGCILISCLGMLASVLDPSINGMMLVEYTSPTLVIAAMAVLLLFSDLDISTPVQKASVFCGPFVFSIYLLHEHPLVREHIIRDRFVGALDLPVVLQVAAVLVIAAGIWLTCFALEWVRHWIFRFLGVDMLLQRLEKRLQDWSCDSPEPT